MSAHEKYERAPYERRRGQISLKGFSIQPGNAIDMERAHHPGGVFLINRDRNGKRFCECCGLAKPRGTRPARKGWKCDDCLAAAAKKIAALRTSTRS